MKVMLLLSFNRKGKLVEKLGRKVNRSKVASLRWLDCREYYLGSI
ncbi:hypothetical protein KP78_25180 [Jeotgalibacillus soli]|uniref:Uncharacterized protein n=1 Tax=Jeotgalibacillus soli TaxID=889306 RepID=A0A0C2RTB2_9BACL|nr:hypothetical protein KP78_25180 [Jeotgalibacillus soli]